MSSRLIDGTTPARKHVHGIVLDSGKEPVHDLLGELGDPDLQEFYAAFAKLSEAPGWDQMGQWFKTMRHAPNTWQVSSSNFRLVGFRHGPKIVLTNGFRKGTKEEQKHEIDKSVRLQKVYKRDQG